MLKWENDCPDRANHTPQPELYMQWHHWAKEMEKTHVQQQCPTCGLWAIWVRTAPAGEERKG